MRATMGEGYPVPAAPVERELVVRRSRFIARAQVAAERSEALAVVAAARADHPDARHHCWACLIGNPESASSAAIDDDGEPGGTAGRPILNVIQHKGIGDVVVVVIRYFGGVKLGAGGLTRAYAQATEQALAALPLATRESHRRLTLTLDFAQEQALRHWSEGHDARIDSVSYADGVSMTLTLPERVIDDLYSFCAASGITVDCK